MVNLSNTRYIWELDVSTLKQRNLLNKKLTSIKLSPFQLQPVPVCFGNGVKFMSGFYPSRFGSYGNSLAFLTTVLKLFGESATVKQVGKHIDEMLYRISCFPTDVDSDERKAQLELLELKAWDEQTVDYKKTFVQRVFAVQSIQVSYLREREREIETPK